MKSSSKIGCLALALAMPLTAAASTFVAWRVSPYFALALPLLLAGLLVLGGTLGR